jgi:hypothetical protein
MIPAAAGECSAGARLAALLVLALALAVLAAPGVRAAESMYVIEQLVVGVTSAPGGEGDRVATIKSGDRVDLLDRQGEEAQIQLTDGTSGWVKASYLSAELPLRRRLQDQTAQAEKLEQEVVRLQSQARAAATAPPGRAAPSAGSPTATPDSSAATRSTSPAGARAGRSADGATSGARTASSADTATAAAHIAGSADTATAASPAGPSDSQGNLSGATRDPSPFMGAEGPTAQPSWLWVVACSLIALVLGFVAGWRVLDRRIRRKYGGLRIY